MRLIATMFAALATVAHADTLDLSLGIPGSTSHRPGTCNTECNEDNNLIFISYVRDSAWGVSAARFDNSYNNPTRALAVNYTWRLELNGLDAFEIRPVLGLMQGYTSDQVGMQDVCPGRDVCPFGALSGTLMLTENIGLTAIQFGPDVRTYALRMRFKL